MFKSQVSIATAVLSVVLFTTSANAEQKNLESAIVKLNNVVNNSIPERYRDQLNDAIQELVSAAQKQCVSNDSVTSEKRSDCEVTKHHYGYFQVTKGTTAMSQSTQFSILTAKSDFDELVKAGICSVGSISADCTIDKHHYGYFFVTRLGQGASQTHPSAITAAKDRADMKRVGLCN